MNNYGFFRAAAAVPRIKVADTEYNANEICRLAERALEQEASLVTFPELSLTGYTCGDLFGQSNLLKGAEKGIRRIISFSRGKQIAIIVGVPVPFNGRLYNCAVTIRNGTIKGIVAKTYIPNHGEHNEARWFASGSDFLSSGGCGNGVSGNGYRKGDFTQIRYAGQRCYISPNMLFEIGDATFAIELGEDLRTPIPPSSYHALAGAQLIVNLSACNEVLMKDKYRNDLLKQQSARTISGYVYASAGFGESSQDLVFSGAASIWENGCQLAAKERFSMESSLIMADLDLEKLNLLRQKSTTFCSTAPDGTPSISYHHLYCRTELGESTETDFKKVLYRHIEPYPFVPEEDMDYRCREILSMQTTGLATRLSHIGCRTAVLGISGGLDSTLALLVAVMAFDRLGWSRERIVGVTMPGYGTTSRTRNNAGDLMDALGVTVREISITAACDRHFADIGHDKEIRDITYENSQARERTQILMDVANQTGGIVIGTGDLSELALGWATYNGDHMSMYGINAGIPKTLVRCLVKWAAKNIFSSSETSVKATLLDIVETPISPELLPADENGKIAQVTEDLVGPYELHDFFLYNIVRFGYAPEKVFFLAKKAFCHTGKRQDMKTPSYDDDTIRKWLNTFIRRFFSQQFKRSCLPDGPKVGTVGLSPRGDWQMPSDAWSTLFLQ